MAKFRITGPDGAKYEINAPDGATDKDVMAYAQQHFGGKGQAPAAPNPYQEVTDEMSGLQRFGAGMGKGFVDVYNGVRQLGAKVGIGDAAKIQKEIDDIKEQSKPLMQTGAGTAGNIGGMVAAALPAAFIPGANTYLGATAIGAGMGAAQPVASDESRLENAALGGIGGAGGQLLGRALVAGAKGTKAVVDPFFEKGQSTIAGRLLNRMAGPEAADVATRAAQAKGLVPGSQPTLAEVAQSPGIAGFQLAAKNVMPEVKDALARQEYGNTAARLNALKEIAGDEGKLAFFKANREQVAGDMYKNAFEEQVADSPWVKGQLTQLMKRPAFRDALKSAQTLARNEGIKLEPKNAVQVAHYTKMALDDQIANATGNEQRALMGIKDQLLTTMESKSFSPSYGAARNTYADMSKPINQMEIGQALTDKLQPALMDFAEGAITRTKAEAYAQALRNAQQTAKQATGFSAKSLEDVMTPEQMSTLKAIGTELSRKATSEDMAKTIGSTTAQNLAGQNILRQFFGPLGLPEQFLDSTALQTVGKAAKVIYGPISEPKIQMKIAEALKNPQLAAQLMQSTQPGTPSIQRAMAEALLRGGSTSAVAAFPLSQR